MFSLLHLPYLGKILILNIHLDQEYMNASLVFKILLKLFMY